MTVFRIDKNRGSDTNDGITAPWKELTKIDDANRTAGDMILLADDSVWEYDLATRILPPVGWTGTEERPVIIGKYSPLSGGLSTQRPTIRWNRIIPANAWTYDAPNNCWVCTMPYTIGITCLVRINGGWLSNRKEVGLPMQSVDGRYHDSGTSFYMYAPSHTNPTDYYGEILLSTAGTGFITLSTGRQWVQVENLRFEDTGCGVLIYSANVADPIGVIVDGLQGDTVASLVSVLTDGTLGQLSATIRNLDVTNWGPNVIWAYTSSGGGIKKLDIHHNRFVTGNFSYAQGAVYAQARSAGVQLKIHHNYVKGARWGSLGSEQDGAGLYLETGAGGVDVYSNVIEDTLMAVQDNSGRANRWFSNLFINCKTAMRGADGVNVGQYALEFVNNTCILGADIPQGAGAGIPSYERGIRVYSNAGNPMPSLTICNNLFYNKGPLAAAAILTPTTTPGVSNYGNNAVWGQYTTVIKREFPPFLAESAPNTVLTDPKLTAGYVPTLDSPLLGAGQYIRRIRDIDSRQMPSPPPIGAYAPATLRTIRGQI